MATMRKNPTAFCGKCGVRCTLEIENTEPDVSYSDRGSVRMPKQTLTLNCECSPSGMHVSESWLNPKEKETTVTQQYDTTTEKSVALANVMNRVRKVEIALFNRAEALAKVEAMHAQHITDASIALDRVLAEAWQVGINVPDFEKHLPDYAARLDTRLEEVVDILSLANAELPV